MLDALSDFVATRTDSCGPAKAQQSQGSLPFGLMGKGGLGALTGKGCGRADVGGGHSFSFRGESTAALSDGTRISVDFGENGESGSLDISFGDGFSFAINGGQGAEDRDAIPPGCAGKASVGVDHCGHAGEDSLISILRDILQALINGDLDEVLEEAGLSQAQHPEKSDQLQFSLCDANKMADTAVPETGLSDDAMTVIQALRDMLDGLARLVDERLEAFGWQDDFRELNQTATHEGPRGTGFSFDLHFERLS